MRTVTETRVPPTWSPGGPAKASIDGAQLWTPNGLATKSGGRCVSSTGTSRRVKTNSRVPFTTVLQLPDLQFAIALHAISSDLDALPARSRPDLSSTLRVPVSGRPARIGNGLAPFLPPLLGPLNHLEIMECWVRRIILGFTACGVSDLTLSADCSLSAEEEQAVCNCGDLRVSLCEHASLSKHEPMGVD
jgi:hypothetical protein